MIDFDTYDPEHFVYVHPYGRRPFMAKLEGLAQRMDLGSVCGAYQYSRTNMEGHTRHVYKWSSDIVYEVLFLGQEIYFIPNMFGTRKDVADNCFNMREIIPNMWYVDGEIYDPFHDPMGEMMGRNE